MATSTPEDCWRRTPPSTSRPTSCPQAGLVQCFPVDGESGGAQLMRFG
jgi:hypothetical protein